MDKYLAYMQEHNMDIEPMEGIRETARKYNKVSKQLIEEVGEKPLEYWMYLTYLWRNRNLRATVIDTLTKVVEITHPKEYTTVNTLGEHMSVGDVKKLYYATRIIAVGESVADKTFALNNIANSKLIKLFRNSGYDVLLARDLCETHKCSTVLLRVLGDVEVPSCISDPVVVPEGIYTLLMGLLDKAYVHEVMRILARWKRPVGIDYCYSFPKEAYIPFSTMSNRDRIRVVGLWSTYVAYQRGYIGGVLEYSKLLKEVYPEFKL